MTERTEEMEGLQDRFVQKYNNAEEKMACNISALGNVICSITLSPHSASVSSGLLQVCLLFRLSRGGGRVGSRGSGGESRLKGREVSFFCNQCIVFWN